MAIAREEVGEQKLGKSQHVCGERGGRLLGATFLTRPEGFILYKCGGSPGLRVEIV